jgi:hypothetical protein
MFELPDHWPIGVNREGNGPVMPDEPGYVGDACACGDPVCELWRDDQVT